MSEYLFDRQKWAALSIFEQMGNIGSEVGRALRAKAKSDNVSMEAAFYRGLDLLDATAEAWVNGKSHRVVEILRARELFVQSIVTHQVDPMLEDYFMQFAMAARIRQFA